jgi:hypothetical protein
MPFIYRSMLIDGDKPKVGCSATALGVRVAPAKDADLPVGPDGLVLPNTGGMSVAPAWRSLPIFRISKRLRDKIEGASGSRSDGFETFRCLMVKSNKDLHPQTLFF